MASIRKDVIEYFRLVRDKGLLPYMDRWRMMDDLRKVGVDINKSFWVKKEMLMNIYQAVIDSLVD